MQEKVKVGDRRYVPLFFRNIAPIGWNVSLLRRDTDDTDIPGFAEQEPDEDEEPGTLENSAVENRGGDQAQDRGEGETNPLVRRV